MSVLSKNKINSFKNQWRETPTVRSVTVMLDIE